MWAFSSYSKQGFLFITVPGLLIVVAFSVAELRLRDDEGQGSLACCSPWGHNELDMT